MAFEIFLNQLKCMYFNISTFDSASLLLGYIYIHKRDPKIHVCILYAKYF